MTESERTKLMCEISRVIALRETPCHAREAGLTLIGWLARRKPEEIPHDLGVFEARQSERILRAAKKLACR